MKVYAYIGLVVALLGFAKWYSDNQYSAGYNTARLESAKLTISVDQAWRKELAEKNTQLDLVQLDLIEEKNNIKIVHKTITKRIKVYVKDDINCNYTRGAVGLFNESWGYSINAGVPESANLSEAEKQETSTITQSKIINKSSEYGEWCTTLEKEIDGLVFALDKLGY